MAKSLDSESNEAIRERSFMDLYEKQTQLFQLSAEASEKSARIISTCFYCVVENRLKQLFRDCPAETIYNNTPVCGAHAVKLMEFEYDIDKFPKPVDSSKPLPNDMRDKVLNVR